MLNVLTFCFYTYLYFLFPLPVVIELCICTDLLQRYHLLVVFKFTIRKFNFLSSPNWHEQYIIIIYLKTSLANNTLTIFTR